MTRLYMHKPSEHEAAQATWVIVADAGRARFFVVTPEQELKELSDLINPNARLQDHDSVSDRRGHVSQGSTTVGHAFQPRESHSEHIAATFAKDLCRRLGTAQRNGEVAHIHLIAEAHFLGLLRQNMDESTHKLIVQQIAADLTRMPVEEIRKALPAKL
ncbi:MAG: host attachment protein [Nevskia sp.]|nr:host attachment protein [Nevskia sp.]